LIVTVSRISVVALLAAGLALAGCGRKGALEPPPSASVAAAPPASGQPSLGEPDHAALESERRDVVPAPFTKKKSFILDFLIAGERPEPPKDGRPVR
jgi:predicted small lipoprotein YifL